MWSPWMLYGVHLKVVFAAYPNRAVADSTLLQCTNGQWDFKSFIMVDY